MGQQFICVSVRQEVRRTSIKAYLNQCSSGFAAIDALVALTILSITIAFSLQTIEGARRVADAALESRQAQSLMNGLLNAPHFESDIETGQSGEFTWRIETELQIAQDAPLQLCDSQVSLQNLRSKRQYQAAKQAFCPVEAST